jgi:hypothetical protein
MSTILYRGLVQSLNSATTYPAVGEFLRKFDDIIVTVPKIIDINNKFELSVNSKHFFNLLGDLRKPIWVHMSMTSGFASKSQANSYLARDMAGYWEWFNNYRLLDYLQGFFLDDFGFEKSYGDSTYVTRMQQINAVQIAHRDYRLPVFVNAYHISDVTTEVGPQGRGGEAGVELWPTIVGQDPIITDKVMLQDPIVTAWPSNPATPTYGLTRTAEALATIKSSMGNLEVIPVQTYHLGNATYDNLFGLTVDSDTTNMITKVQTFLKALGFDNLGVTSRLSSTGEDTDKALDASFITAAENYARNHDGEGYANLYSNSGVFHVLNQKLVDGELVDKHYTFSNVFAYTGEVT